MLEACYREASYYGNRFRRTGKMVSMKLIWELVRDHLQAVREKAARMGIDVKAYKGYALNNDFTSYVSDHIEDRRPDWRGMFEHREKRTEELIREVA